MEFWGGGWGEVNLPTVGKKIVTIMAGAQARNSCGSLLLYSSKILLIACQYIPSLMRFIINN